MARKKIGDILIEKGLITTQQLMEVLEMQKKTGSKVGEILVERGLISEQQLIETISEENPDPLTIDIGLDTYIINKFKLVKVPYKCEQTKQSFVKSMIDVINIKNLLRSKHLGYDAATCKKLFIGEGKEIATWKFNEMAELDQPQQIISSLEGTSYFNVLKDAIEQYNNENSVQVKIFIIQIQLYQMVSTHQDRRGSFLIQVL